MANSREIQLHERDEHRRRQQFVGDRIEDLAEPCHLATAAGQVAVEPVGQRGNAEDRCRHEFFRHAGDPAAVELREQHDDQQRDEHHPRDGQTSG